MIGDLLLISVAVAIALGAVCGGIILSIWLALRAPAVGLAVAGLASLTLLGLWLRSLGV